MQSVVGFELYRLGKAKRPWGISACVGLSVAIWLLSSPITALSADPQSPIDFNQDIRPILSGHCFRCHGPDDETREAELRLDFRESAIESVIDLEDPAGSELIARISSDDPDVVMPPGDFGKPLNDRQRALLKRWIAAGAPYDQHWSYQRPVKGEVPAVTGEVVNEIDHFVLARLAAEDLQPSPAASRHAIIRRLALDVTGLPPTPDEVAKFVADQSPDAYEELVDDFLTRDAYGERWAATWLDLARYADSAGFAEDRKRTIWPFRDYVIRAYVQNKSYRRFTIEQIAGDLLPDASNETRIATAFHRNTLTNSEGGTSDEEFRSAAVIDRVNTTMAVWMGTTMGCAQCHNHKYDPISQKEYFQVYDFLNHTADNDQPDESPILSIYTDEDLEDRAKLERQIAEKESQLDMRPTESEFESWLASRDANQSLDIAGRYVRVDLPGQSKILSLAEVQVFTTNSHGETENVAPQGTATQSSVAFGGPAAHANDGNTSGDFGQKTVTHTATETDPWWQVDLGGTYSIDSISVWNRTGDGLESRLNGFSLSILADNKEPVWNQVTAKADPTETKLRVQEFPETVRQLLTKQSPLTDDEREQVRQHHQQLVRRAKEGEVSVLKQRLRSIKPVSTVPVLDEVADEERRVTKIQIRGSYLNTGDTVTAETPVAFHPLPEDAPRSRLTLANWLVDDENPLTARVVVNRYWEQLFGTGLVVSSEEFGSQGDLPSHPRLLNWLAVDLMEHDWDTRHLLKKIVMSATYRQSSAAAAAALEKDPDNRLLARGPRVRLSAEMIRDQALAVSGLLSKKMYGPPVQPPQPKVGLKPAFTGKTTDWTDSTGEDRYRRAIYTEWRRSAPYPSLSTFDMNSREVCEVRRTSTNTPLQALVILNDPVFVEAAQALARRILSDSQAETDQAAVKYAFSTLR